MTYEEVETILGKPNTISRGYSEIIESNYTKPVIKDYGSLLYVTWLYDDSKEDTLHTLLIRTKTKIDSIPYTSYTYLVNGKPEKKGDYDLVEDSVYRSKFGFIASKRTWLMLKEMWPRDTPNPVKAEKKIIKKTYYIKEPVNYSDTSKVDYIIKKIFTVLFDASSGRIVKWGYLPIYIFKLCVISQLNSKIYSGKKDYRKDIMVFILFKHL